MNPQPIDTYPEEEQAQIEWARKASPAEKFAVIQALSQAAIESAKESIRRDYPNASQEEIRLIFVETLYGRELAEGLRKHLERLKRAGLR